VVVTLGAKTEITNPGLHWHWPWPIESVKKVNVSNIESWQKDFQMLTRDENIVELQVGVQYRIRKPEDFLFQLRSPTDTLEHTTESALREVVGENLMDFVIQQGLTQVSSETQRILQQALDSYKAGIVVTSVNIKRAEAPEEVRAAFIDASRAQEDQHRLVNEAEAYANDILPKARGSAERLREEALGYKGRVMAQAEGDASRFVALAKEYARAPEVTRRRLYLDMNERVLSATTKVLAPRGTAPIIYLPSMSTEINAANSSNTSSLPPPLITPTVTVPAAPASSEVPTVTLPSPNTTSDYDRSTRTP
jgi:membrane protease subunit HflK